MNLIIPLSIILSLISTSHSSPYTTTSQESEFDKIFNAYFNRVFEYHKNDTAAEFHQEINCLKLELSKINSKTQLLKDFNKKEVNEDHCVEVMRLFYEWKSEEFHDDFKDCDGASLPDEAIFRHIIVVLEKSEGEILKEERDSYKNSLQETILALINCDGSEVTE